MKMLISRERLWQKISNDPDLDVDAGAQALLTTPTEALASAAEGFPSWDVLDAAHMLVASLIVDLVSDNERPNFLRKMDRVLRDRVKEIAVRQKPNLVI